MAEAFNPYQEWLELPQKSVRPNFYELLSLPAGESDSEKIAVAADRALAKVRGVRPGERAKAWAGLIDELNNAKRLLLDPTRRAEYDAALKRSASLKSTSTTKQKEVEAAPVAPQPSAAPKGDDPRYPPGMATKTERPAASQPNTASAPSPGRPPEPAPFDSAMLPPGAAHVQPVAPQLAPTPAATDPMVAAPAGWPGAASSYTAIPPQPAAPAAYAQPTGYPGEQYPQQPMYAAQPAYPPGAYQQPVYPPSSYPAPGYAQPAAYSQQPYGYSEYGRPMAAPVAAPPPPPTYDPMAPVAIPVAQPTMSAPMAMPATYAAVAAPAAYTTSAVAAPVGSVPMAVAAPATAAAVPMGQAVAAAPAPSMGVRTTSAASLMAANRRREKSMLTMLVGGGITLAIFVIGAALAYPYLMNGDEAEQVAENPNTSTAASDSVTPAATPTTNFPVGTNPGPPKTNPASPSTPMANTPPVVAPMPSAPNTEPTTTLKPPAGNNSPNENMANAPPTGTSVPPPMPATPAETPAPTPSTPNPPSPTPMPEPTTPTPTPPSTPTTTPAPTTTTPTTEPPPAPMPEMPVVTREDLLALSKALTTARDAVSEHNFEEADNQLKIAEKHAKTTELAEKVARLSQINDMTRQFREAVVAAIQGLDAGEVFTVGSSTQVAVVETFPDKIIVRIAGMNRTYPVEDLPAGLAVALADMKLDTSDPTNRVIKGAYLLSGKDVNADVISKAKTWWEEAQLGGVDVSKLMPFLKDDYEFKKELADLAKADKTTEPKEEE